MSLVQNSTTAISVGDVEKKIYTIRDQQVIMDSDLAEIFQIETRVLKQSVRRNIERFPSDFMFELTKEEQDNLRSQIEILQAADSSLRSQNEILRSEAVISSFSPNQEHFRYSPFAFTEHGVAVLSGILQNKIAVQVGTTIIRAFARLKKQLINLDARFTSYMTRLEGELLDLKDEVQGILQRERLDVTKAIECQTEPRVDQVRIIQDAVASHFNVTLDDLKSNSRLPTITLARHTAIYLVRSRLGLSLNEIGRRFGGRDHSTILYALEKSSKSYN